MGDYDFGLIGLAVMGQNLVLNIERNGFKVAVYNRTTATKDELTELKKIETSRSPLEVARAKSDDKTENASIFSEVVGPGFDLGSSIHPWRVARSKMPRNLLTQVATPRWVFPWASCLRRLFPKRHRLYWRGQPNMPRIGSFVACISGAIFKPDRRLEPLSRLS